MSALPRGICPVCGADVAVRRNGEIRQHDRWETFATGTDLDGHRRARCPGSGRPPTETAEQVRRDRDALRVDLARISAELGLPPRIGPAPGELARLLGYLRALCREAATWVGEQPATKEGNALYLRLRAAGGES